jgi:uncharacterized protein YutE (UPF0331/DUF86 family)
MIDTSYMVMASIDGGKEFVYHDNMMESWAKKLAEHLNSLKGIKARVVHMYADETDQASMKSLVDENG